MEYAFLFDIFEEADDSRMIRLKDEFVGGYVGYTTSTRYANGNCSGTYWNQSATIEAETYEEALNKLASMYGADEIF